MKALLIILTIILVITPFIPWGYTIFQGIDFNANCGDYLRLAADANDVNVAEKHLSKAIEYIEANDLDNGYTKIIFYYPKNDFGLWYENLKSAQTQLREMQETEYTELEESNMLMKLRETILDDNMLTIPFGVSIKHNFGLIYWLNCLIWLPCWVLAIVCGVFASEC